MRTVSGKDEPLTDGPLLSAFSRASANSNPFQFLIIVSISAMIFKIQMPANHLAKFDDSNFARKLMKLTSCSHWFHPLNHPVALALK